MIEQGPTLTRRPQALRNRAMLTGACMLLAAATAALVGYMLATPGQRPMLLAVSEFEATQPLPTHKLEALQPDPATNMTVPAGADLQVQVTSVSHTPNPEQSQDIRWFNDRPIRPAGTMSMLVTAYSPDERSCGKWADGITASGYSVWTNGMKLVAADTTVLPFGSLVSIPGYDGGDVVPVLDRGGAIKGNRLDVLYPTHERALQWGAQRLEVTIWEYADDKPNGFRQSHR